MIKLLLITNRYPAHGNDSASPFVADFVWGLKRHEIDTTILTPYHHADWYEDDESIIRFDWGEGHKTIGSLTKYSPMSWYKISRYITQGNQEAQRLHTNEQFDFCLSLWAAPAGLFARNLKEKFGLNYAVWCLGSDIHTYARLPIIKRRIIEVLKDSERVYADGYELGRMAQDLSGKPCFFLPSLRKVTYLPTSVNKKEKLFVCPGRVEKSKGVFDLLEGFRLIANDYPDWHLYFIGNGSAKKKLGRQVENYGLSSQVKLLGFIDREAMFRLVSKSTAVVIPTLADSLPLTFGEAMQLNRPVIATDVGDLKYFIQKYGVGFVVDPNSPEQLADNLRFFIENNVELDGRFGECVNELSIDRAADNFADWLVSTLEENKPHGESVRC